MSDDAYFSTEPVDFANEAANAGIDAISEHLKANGHSQPDTVLVLVTNTDGRNGSGFSCTDDSEQTPEAFLATLMYHARAVARSMGVELQLVRIGRG